MRKTLVGMATLALCLSVAGPVLAKEPGMEITESSATIEGRGLAAPIHLTSDKDCGVAYPCYQFEDLNDPLVNLSTLTGIVFGPPSYAAPHDVAPAGADRLGPGYEITYSVTLADGVTQTAVQKVYPWAGANGWIFTAQGQELLGREIAAGWTPAPTTLRTSLIDLGIPARPPALPAPVGDPLPVPNPVPVIGVTSILLLALVVGAVILALTRRARRPATLA